MPPRKHPVALFVVLTAKTVQMSNANKLTTQELCETKTMEQAMHAPEAKQATKLVASTALTVQLSNANKLYNTNHVFSPTQQGKPYSICQHREAL